MKRLFGFVVLACLAGMSPAGAQQQAPLAIAGATTVDAERIVALVGESPDLVIIDTRHVEDFNRGHIEGSIRILDTDLTEQVLAQHVRARTVPVLFYCNGLACGRAAKATEMAVRLGYTRVYYYALGMNEWMRLNLPVQQASSR